MVSQASARVSIEGPPGDPSQPAPAEAGVRGAFSCEELRRISEEVAKSFPQALEGTWVVLVDVDPYRLHAYWHVDPQDLEATRRRLRLTGEQPLLVLWFHDAACQDFRGTDASIEVEGQGPRGRCYVDVRGDATTYVADLGLRDADGNLALLARSNPVDIPRTGAPESSHPCGGQPAAAMEHIATLSSFSLGAGKRPLGDED